LTLQHWLRRLETHHDRVLRTADEVTYRIWRLYTAAAIHQFSVGHTSIYQVLLSKPDQGRSELSLTRAHWYS
jgi:cyclopropane-fatty-acyl-phospholipid synthase